MGRATRLKWRLAPVPFVVALIVVSVLAARATVPYVHRPQTSRTGIVARLHSPPKTIGDGGAVYPPNLQPSPALPHSPAFLEAASNAARQQPKAAHVDAQVTPESSRAAAQSGDAQGVDVAAYQHTSAPINWSTVAGQYQFAYIKATEVDPGNLYVNPFYSTDVPAAMAAGLYVGGYDFATPDVAPGNIEAADFLDQTAYHFGPQVLVPMIDLENDPYGSDPCYGLSQASMIGWIAAYTQEIVAILGRPPVIYTGTPWWNQCTGGTSAFDANPLWIAAYGVSAPTLPSGFSQWELWQYAVGTAAGITGPADLDEFAGNVSALVSKLTDDTSGELATSGPVDASPASGRLDVFYRGSDGSVWDGTTINGTTTHASLGGLLAPGTSPAAVSWGPNRMDVFVDGVDNQLYHDAWSGKGWSGWQGLGGLLSSSPTVSSWAPGRLDVFIAGVDDVVYHAFYAGQWYGWQYMGGLVAPGTAPAAASWGPNRIDLFLTGVDHQLWHTWWDGTSWYTTYQAMGGILTSSPAVAAWGPGRLDIFAAGTDYGLYHLWWSGAWGGWEAHGGVLDSAPGATSEGPGTLEVVVRGVDSGTWLTTFGATGWTGFSSLPDTVS